MSNVISKFKKKQKRRAYPFPTSHTFNIPRSIIDDPVFEVEASVKGEIGQTVWVAGTVGICEGKILGRQGLQTKIKTGPEWFEGRSAEGLYVDQDFFLTREEAVVFMCEYYERDNIEVCLTRGMEELAARILAVREIKAEHQVNQAKKQELLDALAEQGVQLATAVLQNALGNQPIVQTIPILGPPETRRCHGCLETADECNCILGGPAP